MFLLNTVTLVTITMVTMVSQIQASFSGSGGAYFGGGWNQNQQTRQSFQPWQRQRQQYPQQPSQWRNSQYPQQPIRWRGDTSDSNSNSNSDSNSGGYVFRRPQPQPNPFYQQYPQPRPQPQPQPDPFYQQLPQPQPIPQPDPFYQQLPQPQPQPLPQPNPFYQIPQPQTPTYVQPDPNPFYNQNQPPPAYVPPPNPVPVQPPVQNPYVPVPDFGVESDPVIEIIKQTEEPPVIIVNPPTMNTPKIIDSPANPVVPEVNPPVKITDPEPNPDPVVVNPIPIVTDPPVPITEIKPIYIDEGYTPTTTTEPTTTIDINDIPNRGDSPYSNRGNDDFNNALGTILDDIETGFILNEPQSLVGSSPDPTVDTTYEIEPKNTDSPVLGQDPDQDQQILTNVFESLLDNLQGGGNNQDDPQDSIPTTQSPEVREFIDSLYSNGNPFAMMNTGTNNNQGSRNTVVRSSLNSNSVPGTNVVAQGFADRPEGNQHSGLNPFLR